MKGKTEPPNFGLKRLNRVDQTLAEARSRLAPFSESAGLDAQVLLSHVLGKPKVWLLAHPEYELSIAEEAEFNRSLTKLATGTPLAYLLGHWEFYGLDFQVTPDVLIPRPETELLVGIVLEWLQRHPNQRRAAEAGTGSGCIAVSLAVNCTGLSVCAGDISRPALRVAKANCNAHRVEERIRLFQADLLGCLAGPFDVLAANLPYIPSLDLQRLVVYEREPALALDGGPDGMDIVRRFLVDARRILAPGGLIAAEIEAGQGDAARTAAVTLFPIQKVSILKDLAGRDRLLRIDDK